eukprot:716826-Amphidinium_carterae.2
MARRSMKQHMRHTFKAVVAKSCRLGWCRAKAGTEAKAQNNGTSERPEGSFSGQTDCQAMSYKLCAHENSLSPQMPHKRPRPRRIRVVCILANALRHVQTFGSD